MRFGIITRNRQCWSTAQLEKALAKRNIESTCSSFPRIAAHVACKPYLSIDDNDALEKIAALIVRPIGRGSLEEIIFRMDMLYRLQRLGTYVVNPPEAIEHCSDKYDILAILEENDVPVPRTIVTEDAGLAMKAFKELGEDVVLKPIFGSRGMGSARITDVDVATTIFRSLTLHHSVIYLQEFISHGTSDVRAFVIGDQVIASMRRVADNWKTNYSQGARVEPLKLSKAFEELVVKSAKLVDCKIAGVDVLESSNGPLVVEVNSRPGWKGLQSVTDMNIADEIIGFVLRELKK